MKIEDLYQKVSEFEDELRPNLTVLSNCKKGCSQCCHTDISVFGVEAKNIRNWFQGLNENERSEIRNRWNQKKAINACAFLRSDACTIYEARPLICRTQGLALQFKEDLKTYIDICPLNESMLETANEREIMNLDLLNQVLSEIERMDATGTPRDRMRLEDLQILLDSNANVII